MKVNVRDAARMLEVSEKTIYRWIEKKKLPVRKVNEQYRFNRAELLEWATANHVQLSVELFREPEGQPVPRLSEAIEAGGIHYRVGGATREAALRHVIALMRLPDEVDKQYLFEMLVAREMLASTGVGDGIAIPHVRNPVVLHVQPSITLSFLDHAVDFGSLDRQPVRVLFLMVSPTTRSHLYLLSCLSSALHDPELKELVRGQGSREEILGSFRVIESSFPPVSGGKLSTDSGETK